MQAIVAVDENWGIGYNDELLCKIPGDMKHFKELTKDKVNVIGRRTYDNIPLSYRNRINTWIVFCSHFEHDPYDSINFKQKCTFIEKPEPKAILTYDMKFDYFRDFVWSNRNDLRLTNDNIIFVGGETVYTHFYEYFDKIFVTKIHKSFDRVNKYFPNIDNDRRFEITDIEAHEENGIKYDFITYERKTLSMNREKFSQNLFYREPWEREYIKRFVGKMEETNVCTTPVSEDVPNPRSLIVMIEEFSEAQKELSKFLRGKGDEEGLLEEMADVQICLFKYQRLFGISDELLNKAMCIKLDEFDENYPDCHLKEEIERQIKMDKEKM